MSAEGLGCACPGRGAAHQPCRAVQMGKWNQGSRVATGLGYWEWNRQMQRWGFARELFPAPSTSGPKNTLGQNVSRVEAFTAWSGKQEQTGRVDGFGVWGFFGRGSAVWESLAFFFFLFLRQNFHWKQRVVNVSFSPQVLAEPWYVLQCPADAGGCSQKFVSVLVCPKLLFDTKSGFRHRQRKVECGGVFSSGLGTVSIIEQKPRCPEVGPEAWIK